MRKMRYFVALLSSWVWVAAAHGDAYTYVKADATLSMDNPGKVYTGPRSDPHRSELDTSNRFNWQTTGTPKTWECHYHTPGKGFSDADASFSKQSGQSITADTWVDLEARDGGLAFGFADVTGYQIELSNITGALGTPRDIWTDWTLTVDWRIRVSTGSGDVACGGMVVGVDTPDGRDVFSKELKASNGETKEEPAGGADETRSYSFKVPGKQGGIGKVTISLDSLSSGYAFAGDPPPGAPPSGDFGDAPVPYPTPGPIGPKYGSGETRLGLKWDREDNGTHSGGADSDDSNPPGGEDDEDGVQWGDNRVVIGITSNNTTEQMVHLDGWIDLAEDGVFDHKSDQILDEVLLVAPGYSELEWEYAALGLDGSAIQGKYARVRLTVIDDPGNMWPGGVDEFTDVTPDSENLAAEDGLLVPGLAHGEVEDYLVPEPGSLSLLALGGLALIRRPRKA